MGCMLTIQTRASACFQEYTFIVDILLVLCSFGVFVFDLLTDLINAFQYRYRSDSDEDTVYFALSLAFVIFPSLIVQISSVIFLINDYKGREKFRKKHAALRYTIVLLHALQMAPLYWYGRTIYFCAKAHQNRKIKNEEFELYEAKSKYGMHDGGLLRVIESFLEAAPQLVLQTYIMVTTGIVPAITVLSCAAGVVGITTSMVGFQRAVRASSNQLNNLPIFPSAIVMSMWRMLAVVARVLALTLLATTCWWWFLLMVGVHCVLSYIVINVCRRGTQEDLCPKSIAAQSSFNAICSIIYVFCYFNIHNNESRIKIRHRMAIYYTLTTLENITCSVLWYYYRTGGMLEELWSKFNADETVTTIPMTTKAVPTTTENVFTIKLSISLVLAITVNVVYAIGLFFMIIYYKFFHPNIITSKKKESVKKSLVPSNHVLEGENETNSSTSDIREEYNEKSNAMLAPNESRSRLIMVETLV